MHAFHQASHAWEIPMNPPTQIVEGQVALETTTFALDLGEQIPHNLQRKDFKEPLVKRRKVGHTEKERLEPVTHYFGHPSDQMMICA
jgi:hypothetical protein